MVKINREMEKEQNREIIVKKKEKEILNSLIKKLKLHGLTYQTTYWIHSNIVKLKIPSFIFRISHLMPCEEVSGVYQEGNFLKLICSNHNYLEILTQIGIELEKQNNANIEIEMIRGFQ